MPCRDRHTCQISDKPRGVAAASRESRVRRYGVMEIRSSTCMTPGAAHAARSARRVNQLIEHVIGRVADTARVQHERVPIRLLQPADVPHVLHTIRSAFDQGHIGLAERPRWYQSVLDRLVAANFLRRNSHGVYARARDGMESTSTHQDSFARLS